MTAGPGPGRGGIAPVRHARHLGGGAAVLRCSLRGLALCPVTRTGDANPAICHPATCHPAIRRMSSEHDVTALLELASNGDRSALDRVFPLVYEELRGAAHRQLRREPRGHTLSTVGLVHEAYFRLVDQTRVQFRGRAHFLAVAATAMRRILVDYARGRAAEMRGGGRLQQVDITIDALLAEERADVLVDLDEALDRLSALDARQARVIECRFFGGLTEDETAEALDIAVRTVRRDWVKARAWLYQELFPGVA